MDEQKYWLIFLLVPSGILLSYKNMTTSKDNEIMLTGKIHPLTINQIEGIGL